MTSTEASTGDRHRPNVLPITGYLDKLSVRPGECITAYVSVFEDGLFEACLQRVVSADPNPAGPGMVLEDLGEEFRGTFQGRAQSIDRGSYGIVHQGPKRSTVKPCTWTVLLWAQQFNGEPRPILAEENESSSIVIFAASGGVRAQFTTSVGEKQVFINEAMELRTWYRLWFSADPQTGEVLLGLQKIVPFGEAEPSIMRSIETGLLLPNGGVIRVAASDPEHRRGKFNGRLEDPAILQRFLTSWHGSPETPVENGPDILAAWDFSMGIDTQTIHDRGTQKCDGKLMNLPMRAARGARWRGNEMNWRHAPEQYGAIHFSDNMVGDCGWRPDFSFTVRDGLGSGAYAFRLCCAAGEDWLPFYILPPHEEPRRRVAFLAPTFTYQAYANHARGNADELYRDRVTQWRAYPHNPDDFPIYGGSAYNLHSDGSAIIYSSRLRPVLTLRPGFITFNDSAGSGLRHYPADSHILAWLEAKKISFDVITDEDLDAEGMALLDRYKVVLTGTHPEYCTAGMLDALHQYTLSGGRLIYLGGNGFYWRIARGGPGAEGAIEVRRAEGGTRDSFTEPGEYYHAFDGCYGGLWRRNGRPPQALVGIGFTAFKIFEAGRYRRTPKSYDPECAWIFVGVEGEIFGDYGLSAGGAAGFELDQINPALGTPTNTMVLAQSDSLPSGFCPATEELLTVNASVDGEPIVDLLRGDMVYFTRPGGGAVFSVGSITFCGSLWRNGFDGPVSRLLENVVRRFAQLEC